MDRVFNRIIRSRGKIKESNKGDIGYKLVMSIIDRKVFSVEDESVTEEEFNKVSKWVVDQYEESCGGKRTLGGRVIKEEPIMVAEVIEGDPVFIEILDFDVRYRVNMYQDRKDIDIRVLEAVKEKELQYGYTKEVSYQL